MRRWWILAGFRTGPMPKVYHHLSGKGEEIRVACGLKLPFVVGLGHVYGKFYDLRQTEAERRKARCSKCVEALERRRV